MEQLSIIDELRVVISEVEYEVLHAISRFPPMRSAHEGEAIIREEMDELTQSIRHRSGADAYAEAKQLAAMAIRYMLDIGSAGAEKPST